MFCTKCGFQNQDNAEYCVKCGNKLLKNLNTKNNDNNIQNNSKFIINTPDFIGRKIIYDVVLSDNDINICKSTSSQPASNSVNKNTTNFACNYNEIAGASVKTFIRPIYYIPLVIGLILSLNALIFLLITFAAIYFGYYRTLRIHLKSGEKFNILYKNNNLDELLQIENTINSKSVYNYKPKSKMSNINFYYLITFPLLTLSMILFNYAFSSTVFNTTDFKKHNILLGCMSSKDESIKQIKDYFSDLIFGKDNKTNKDNSTSDQQSSDNSNNSSNSQNTKKEFTPHIVELSDEDTKILSHLINYGKGLLVDTSNSQNFKSNIYTFYNFIIIKDYEHLINFNYQMNNNQKIITKDYAKKLIKDGLNMDISLSDITPDNNNGLDSNGNLLLCDAIGESDMVAINKIIETKENEYDLYVNDVNICDAGYSYNGSYKVHAIKNDDSIFGYTLLSLNDNGKSTWPVKNISASSTLSNIDNNSYTTSNLIDGNKNTAWAEGSDGPGENEYLTFTSNEESTVTGVLIANGYLKSNDTFNKNSRPSQLKFEFSDGTSFVKTLDSDMYSNLASLDNQLLYTDYIPFNKEIKTSSIKVTIVSVSAGTKFNDTCISEIKFIN